ncbi:MAG: thiamine pyrophosphate-dependent dehydrogenase E1 component subunit alpha [Actinobacteria bacterium]|nr:thiamine pyrophosphate-dependent dehydrogenase E1 component subunit alpha [Actinomycetota bacterium]
MDLSKEEKIKIYIVMKKIRLFEEAAFLQASLGLIAGSTHFYIGQEAVAAGVCYCLKKEDYIMSNHRCHGHLIAKGGDIKKMMAELMGKSDGYCKGKGGTMHLLDPEVGMMGANGIVGSSIPISTGLSYACKNFRKDSLVVCFFGDGAINTGAFHESLNIAALWKLPIIYVCENNKYAISTDVSKSTSTKDLSERAKSFGIKGFNIDGNEVIKVIETIKNCIDYIRNENTPSLVICNTYRQMGHSINDSKTYRTKDEEDCWREKDPIKKYEKILISGNIIDRSKINKINDEINKEINLAVEFGKNSKTPDLKELSNDIYA